MEHISTYKFISSRFTFCSATLFQVNDECINILCLPSCLLTVITEIQPLHARLWLLSRCHDSLL